MVQRSMTNSAYTVINQPQLVIQSTTEHWLRCAKSYPGQCVIIEWYRFRKIAQFRKKVMGKITLYDDTVKINAAYLYAASGNYSQVARDTNISRPTLMGWAKNNSVWVEALNKARQEISDEILASNLEIVIKTNEQVMDRVEYGDVVLRNGKQVRVPMKGRDLAVVGGIKEDKARVALGQATSIVGKSEDIQALAKQFDQLAQSFKEKQVNVVATQEKDREKE